MKPGKKNNIIFLLTAGLLFFPLLVYGQSETTNEPSAIPLPSRVKDDAQEAAKIGGPQGDMALQLVRGLNIGEAQNGTQAGEILSKFGIEPKAGWIAGHPVTPDIIREIEESLVASVDTRKIAMDKDRALQVLNIVKSKYGFAAQPVASSPPADLSPSRGTANKIIYKYIDNKGVVHFTNIYESIPKKYLSRIKTIEGSTKPSSPARTTPQASPVR